MKLHPPNIYIFNYMYMIMPKISWIHHKTDALKQVIDDIIIQQKCKTTHSEQQILTPASNSCLYTCPLGTASTLTVLYTADPPAAATAGFSAASSECDLLIASLPLPTPPRWPPDLLLTVLTLPDMGAWCLSRECRGLLAAAAWCPPPWLWCIICNNYPVILTGTQL